MCEPQFVTNDSHHISEVDAAEDIYMDVIEWVVEIAAAADTNINKKPYL